MELFVARSYAETTETLDVWVRTRQNRTRLGLSYVQMLGIQSFGITNRLILLPAAAGDEG
jgi:hypothetical protein